MKWQMVDDREMAGSREMVVQPTLKGLCTRLERNCKQTLEPITVASGARSCGHIQSPWLSYHLDTEHVHGERLVQETLDLRDSFE